MYDSGMPRMVGLASLLDIDFQKPDNQYVLYDLSGHNVLFDVVRSNMDASSGMSPLSLSLSLSLLAW
jgi:hypothetical protein